MGAVGVLIFFAVVGAVICAKARVAGGAVVFALIALGLFVTTPVGSGLPGMLSDFISAVSQASQPLTTGGPGAVG
jgi:multisubunit Na+/H+ antiporter MnhG subunit